MLRTSTLVFLSYLMQLGFANAQDKIKGYDVLISDIKITNFNSKMVYFKANNEMNDSIPAEKLTNVFLKDSLNIVVIPDSLKGKRKLINFKEFAEALSKNDLFTLFQSYFHYYDIKFINVKGNLNLTNESKEQIKELTTLLKKFSNVSINIAVHADSVGSVATNQMVTERRAKVLNAELLRSGISSKRFNIVAKGESEPFVSRPFLSRRLEVSISKIAKVEILYSQKYIPPVSTVTASEVTSSQTNSYSGQLNKTNEEKQSTAVYNAPKRYKHWILTFGGEALQTVSSKSPQWADENLGLGFSRTIGGVMKLTRRYNRFIALDTEAGYYQWTSVYSFTQNSQLLYGTTYNLVRVPFAFGLKLYPINKLFLSYRINIEGLRLSYQTDENNVLKATTENQFSVYQGSSAEVGYSIISSKYIELNASLTYTSLSRRLKTLTSASPITDPLKIIGIRINAGFKIQK